MGPKMQLAIWIAHPIVESVLAIIMVRRKMHRHFPVFFAYILSQILNFAIVFPIYLNVGVNYNAYFYAYWAGAAVSLAIGFKVIHEVFLDVFRPYHTLKDLGTVLFKWAALVMLLVALVVAASSPANSRLPITQAVVTVQRCVRVIQCGLILFLLVFSRYLGVSWRQHSFGIALGFGGFASVELCAVALYSGGQIRPNTQNTMVTTAYLLSILVWICYAAFKAPAREAPATLLTSRRWEQSLNDLQTPAAGDSLIPMFEGMVERAFSRTPNGEEIVERQLLTLSERTKSSETIGTDTPPKRR
jgi:hypothetical protein